MVECGLYDILLGVGDNCTVSFGRLYGKKQPERDCYFAPLHKKILYLKRHRWKPPTMRYESCRCTTDSCCTRRLVSTQALPRRLYTFIGVRSRSTFFRSKGVAKYQICVKPSNKSVFLIHPSSLMYKTVAAPLPPPRQ